MLGHRINSILIFFTRNKILTTFFLSVLLVFISQVNLTDYPQSTIISKFIVFSYCCIVLLCIAFLEVLKQKKVNISVSSIDIALFSLVSYLIVNRYFIQADYSFSIRYLELLGLMFLYLIIRTLQIKVLYWLLLAIVVSGIIQAVYGNLQLLGYFKSNHAGFKLTGSFFNPGPYAGFLISVFPIALGLYLFREKVTTFLQIEKKYKSPLQSNTILKYVLEYFPLLGVVSIVLVIPASQSRAAWLSLVVSSSFILEFHYKFLKKRFLNLSKLKKTILIATSLLFVVVSLLGIYHFKKGSSDGRLFIWKTSTEIVKDNPIFGVGFDRFKTHYMNYQAEYFSKYGETKEALVADNSNYAFNELVQFTVENGFVGFLFLLALCFFILKVKTNKENQFLRMILKISLLSISVFAFFSYPMQILPTKILLFSCLAFLANLDSGKKIFKITTISILGNTIAKGALLLLIVMVSFKSYSYTKELSRGFLIWKEGLESYQYGNYEDAMYAFEEAYTFFYKNGDFLMNYGKALSISKKNKKAITILSEAKLYLNNTIIETALGDAYKGDKQYTNAELAYTKAYDMIPVRFYPLYLLAKLYGESGQKKKAIEIAHKVLEKEVKVKSTAIKEIKMEMEKILKRNS